MIKAYVITIMDNKRSLQVAKRCVKHAAYYGIDVELFEATTPKDKPIKMLKNRKIKPAGFTEVYSRPDRCMSAFLSHHRLWEKCAEENNEPYIIFEHDAIMTGQLGIMPRIHWDAPVLDSIGAPSYGKFNTPSKLGLNKLMSKQYLPGAHAYIINPQAAKALIDRAKIDASPTDVFIHNDRFNFLHELYPYIAEAKDNFTTIQKEQGCLAKHGYGEAYDII